VRRTLDPGKFTIKSIRQRVDRLGDLWEPVLGRGVDLRNVLDKLAATVAATDEHPASAPA
jgi:bifunctional non-homologous end joining protein LigD